MTTVKFVTLGGRYDTSIVEFEKDGAYWYYKVDWGKWYRVTDGSFNDILYYVLQLTN